MCYPCQMMIPTPRSPPIEMTNENEIHTLKFKGENLRINSPHFFKLVSVLIIQFAWTRLSNQTLWSKLLKV
jgi:hypothetical protein